VRKLTRIGVLIAASAALAACAGPRTARRSRLQDGTPIAKTALSQIGKPYRFGGNSPKTGFDCSGLVWWSHRRHRIAVPRTSKMQFRGGRKVKTRKLHPGDLVFFSTYKRGASHVGVFTGKGRFVHAPSSGKKVRQSRINESYWKKRYLGARRYW